MEFQARVKLLYCTPYQKNGGYSHQLYNEFRDKKNVTYQSPLKQRTIKVIALNKRGNMRFTGSLSLYKMKSYLVRIRQVVPDLFWQGNVIPA